MKPFSFRPITLLFLCFSIHGLNAQRLSGKEYIEKFKEDAVKEMYLHKIPASIVLAQAMFESDNGNSELAKNANNHFGIKCKKEWTGETYAKDDEEEQECFRKYCHVLESYSDHSIFLLTRPRYAFLFEIPLSDYKAWSNGLKDAGYATDPKYAKRLIDIIEKYKLFEFDRYQSLSKPEFPGYITEGPTLALRDVYMFNRVKFIVIQEGDSYFKIASQFNIELEKLLEYNDIKRGEKIQVGQKLFLEPKRSRAKEPYHVVQSGETLNSISQLHGIKLAVLCKNNRLLPGDSLETGEILYLRGKKPFRLTELLPESPVKPTETAGKY